MILDSSAIAAVVFREPGFESLLDKIASAADVAIGAPTIVEAGMVIGGRLGRDARSLITALLYDWEVETVPFGEDHWKEALEAATRYGRGRHRAGLNFGDCLAYSVAKLADQPLLCTGQDFPKTDLTLA
jgi:ribonuclease VapC